MNTIISNTRKALQSFTWIIVFITGCLVTRAAGNEPNERNHTGSASSAEVKFSGGQEGEFLFNVSYNNAAGSKFSIRVLDETGSLLYQGVFTDRKFDKKFKVLNADSYGKLVFIIRNFGDNSTQSFEINSNSRLLEEVEVKEVR